jgi:hypothetical protein
MYKPGQTLVYCGNSTFRTIIDGVKRYWQVRNCEYCGQVFLTDKYNNVEYCSKECKGDTRGRPIGTELDDYTKSLIAEGRTGLHHNKDTKHKISEQCKIGIENSIFKPGYFSLTGEYHPWFKHGETRSPLWLKWINIKQRCDDPNNKAHKYYYDKGIRVCEKWSNDFITFKDWCENNGYKSGLHIHRKDPLGNYEPDNCEFLTPSEHSKIHHKLRRLSKNE